MEYITSNKGGRKLPFENNISIKQKVLSNGTVWGDIMGGFCPGGFCPRGDFVLGGILSGGFCPGGFCPRTIGGYHQYIGGCSVHRRDTMSTLGGGS